MTAEEALAHSQGKAVYAVYHGDLFRLTQREDGHYVQDVLDLEDSTRGATYLSTNLARILKKDRRYLAEWYLTEEEARNAKQPEEFYVYTMALYQHKDTKEVVSVKFCNGEIIGLIPNAVLPKTRGQHSLLIDTSVLRDFLYHTDKYRLLTSYWLQTSTQSQRDKGARQEEAERTQKYRYVYFNLRDSQEYDQYTKSLRDAIRLAHAHMRGTKKQPISIEGPAIGKIELHPEKLPGDKFRIPELEPFEEKA